LIDADSEFNTEFISSVMMQKI